MTTDQLPSTSIAPAVDEIPSSSSTQNLPLHAIMSNGSGQKGEGELDRDIKTLREEIHALKWLSDRKEREWNKILRLLKMKEEKLLLKNRKRTLVQRESRVAAASLLVTAASGGGGGATKKPSSTSSLTISPVVKTEKKSKSNPDCQGCNSKTSLFVCAGCGNRWYCSQECQASDWDEHADFCSDDQAS